MRILKHDVRDRNPTSAVIYEQGAGKVVSNLVGLVDFAVRLVSSVLHLPDRKSSSCENSWGNLNYRALVRNDIWGAGENNFQASTSLLQLVLRASTKMAYFAQLSPLSEGLTLFGWCSKSSNFVRFQASITTSLNHFWFVLFVQFFSTTSLQCAMCDLHET